MEITAKNPYKTYKKIIDVSKTTVNLSKVLGVVTH